MLAAELKSVGRGPLSLVQYWRGSILSDDAIGSIEVQATWVHLSAKLNQSQGP